MKGKGSEDEGTQTYGIISVDLGTESETKDPLWCESASPSVVDYIPDHPVLFLKCKVKLLIPSNNLL